jgi:hypothetical protein
MTKVENGEFWMNDKLWRVVGIRVPADGESYVADGEIRQPSYAIFTPRTIVQEIPPEWITPTDEDALSRPVVQVRDCLGDKWLDGVTLIYAGDGRYCVVSQGSFSSWRYCRIRNPAYKPE